MATAARLTAALFIALLLASLLVPRPSLTSGCGPASLYALCRRCRISAGWKQTLTLFGDHTALCSFADIMQAAGKLGLPLQPEQMSLARMQREHPLGILHLDSSHFVTAVGYTSCGPLIENPTGGLSVRQEILPYPLLARRWDGAILVARNRP